MPLRDHFHPPLFPQRAWESFHTQWASSIGARLNQLLPRRFFAQVQTHLGSRVEADVAEFEQLNVSDYDEAEGNGPGGSIAIQAWAPPVATLSMPTVFPDTFEVQVRDERDDARLVAVVELVSPGNKDRPETRLAFATKSAAYLERGIGRIVVDIVAGRNFNLHNELLPLLNLDSRYAMPDDPALYATAYRPIQRGIASLIDAWPVVLSIGSVLPLLPLGLRGFKAVPLDLELTYEEACRRDRI
jgi:Protein of unknown function (DUF4058)